jgi:hypothetical protein
MEKHEIYKQDKWNMILAEVKGTKIEVREISTEWGEEKFIFHSRPEMMHWVENKFKRENYSGQEEVYEQIVDNFRNV